MYGLSKNLILCSDLKIRILMLLLIHKRKSCSLL